MNGLRGWPAWFPEKTIRLRSGNQRTMYPVPLNVAPARFAWCAHSGRHEIAPGSLLFRICVLRVASACARPGRRPPRQTSASHLELCSDDWARALDRLINLLRRGLFVGWHRFASGFVQAPGADFPRFRSALALTAVKFANGTILRDRLDNLVSEPLPAATKRLVAFQLLFGHGVEPHSDGDLPGRFSEGWRRRAGFMPFRKVRPVGTCRGSGRKGFPSFRLSQRLCWRYCSFSCALESPMFWTHPVLVF